MRSLRSIQFETRTIHARSRKIPHDDFQQPNDSSCILTLSSFRKFDTSADDRSARPTRPALAQESIVRRDFVSLQKVPTDLPIVKVGLFLY
jgi:hypothetical protein